MIEAIFLAFGIVALVLFRYLAPAVAVAITCFAGWLVLPVGNFPEGSANVVFPYWITGLAVPSDMLFTKMWWPPVIALIGAAVADLKTLARLRPRWFDVPMALWCMWPLAQWPFVANPDPQPWISSLYITAAWGAPWVLGRAYFSGRDGGRLLITAMVAGLIVIVPIAIIEGIFGPIVYSWLYELHPFRFDGVQRYVSFRPLGFFEDGNQYGIWVAATALAAIWLWQSAPKLRERNRLALVAGLAILIAVISQSIGAILLLLAGLVMCWSVGRPVMRWLLLSSVLLVVPIGLIYLSGVVPLRAIAENTAVGRKVVDVFRSSGRGSFTWRIARDQGALNLVGDHPVIGSGQWNWWRENAQRPWGLFLLILGEFGGVGLILALSTLLPSAVRALIIHWNGKAYLSQPAIPFAAIILMAAGDALLNSFFFYPAILASAALSASCDGNQRGELGSPAR